MKKNSQQIKCPKCGEIIDINKVLYHELEEEISQDYNRKLDELESREAEIY